MHKLSSKIAEILYHLLYSATYKIWILWKLSANIIVRRNGNHYHLFFTYTYNTGAYQTHPDSYFSRVLLLAKACQLGSGSRCTICSSKCGQDLKGIAIQSKSMCFGVLVMCKVATSNRNWHQQETYVIISVSGSDLYFRKDCVHIWMQIFAKKVSSSLDLWICFEEKKMVRWCHQHQPIAERLSGRYSDELF